MNEPLKDKLVIDDYLNEYYWHKDVTSAVKGFLEEIDCMTHEGCTILRCDVEELAVKWFRDVLE